MQKTQDFKVMNCHKTTVHTDYMPNFQALDALNKEDLAEVKSYGRPPAAVEIVMEAVMIFKQVEPTWAEAKRQLEDPSFLLQVRNL